MAQQSYPELPQWLLAQYERQMTTQQPTSLAALRNLTWQAFQQLGLPQSHDERWKYANLAFLSQPFTQASSIQPTIEEKTIEARVALYRQIHQPRYLIVILDGKVQVAHSDLAHLPLGLTITNYDVAPSLYAETIQASVEGHAHALAHLNSALSTHDLFIQLAEGVQLAEPIHLLSLTHSVECALHSTLVLRLQAHSQLSIVHHFQATHEGAYLQNTVSHIELAEGASLNYSKIQTESPAAQHLSQCFVRQANTSAFNYQSFSLSGQFSRDECVVDLEGKRSQASCSGFYATQWPNQYVDQHVDIYHRNSQTESEMFFKGIATCKSRAVFNGRLYVAQNAQKTNAYQANHTLLLSPLAEVYSKPELEIYADDVKCKHGATTGQLDEEALFYLCSRGISQIEASQLLLKGFADEALQRVTDVKLRHYLQNKVMNYGNSRDATH